MQDYTDQLLDFMYVDRVKVASLLAQFLSEGLVEEQRTSKTSSQDRAFSLGASTGKIVALLGFSADWKGASADTTAETVKKNPEWAQAKALVQYVSDAQAQSIDDPASVGSLRILTGELAIYDLTPFRQIVENPRLMDAASETIARYPALFLSEVKELDLEISALEDSKATNRNISQINSDISKIRKKRDEIIGSHPSLGKLIVEGIAEFVRRSPFSIIAVLEADGERYWFTLKESSLLHDQGDTLLKYGFQIEGQWSVACIVDGSENPTDGAELAMANNDGQGSAFAYQMAQGLATASRFLAGRPSGYRSLMPLVVFRSLGRVLK